jgi:hypothetical protein
MKIVMLRTEKGTATPFSFISTPLSLSIHALFYHSHQHLYISIAALFETQAKKEG